MPMGVMRFSFAVPQSIKGQCITDLQPNKGQCSAFIAGALSYDAVICPLRV
jgi:hypothetical protein